MTEQNLEQEEGLVDQESQENPVENEEFETVGSATFDPADFVATEEDVEEETSDFVAENRNEEESDVPPQVLGE